MSNQSQHQQISLSPEQKAVFNKYLAGENVFVTGPGGTGKTALIRAIYAHATAAEKRHKETDSRRKYSASKIAVCALTGCAAQLLGCNARTIHSWAGIGLGTEPAEFYIKKLLTPAGSSKKKNWMSTNILIIDEVSMMSTKLFDLLNAVAKGVRKNSEDPFGGLQVILSGDFYQLPPVIRSVSPDDSASAKDAPKFCFESADWWDIFGANNCIELKTIFRQKDDKYAQILNQLREGIIKKSSVQMLNAQLNKPRPAGLFIQPTKIYPLRAQVDTINAVEMAKLPGESRLFKMKYEVATTYTNAITESIATVIELANTNTNPSKAIKAEHVYSAAELRYEFEYMQTSLLCDTLLELKEGAQVMCMINGDFSCVDQEVTIESANGTHGMVTLYNGCQGVVTRFIGTTPIVKFYGIGQEGVEVIMQPHSWESERMPGVIIKQYPLLLSWAITIHKSQGATLEHAEIDIGRNIFEDGQTYVALSRVTSIEGLYLSAFDPDKIRINKKVKAFYGQLRAMAAVAVEDVDVATVAVPQRDPNVKTIVVR